MAWGSAYTPEFRVASIVGAAQMNTTQANDRRLCEVVTGAPTFVIDAIDTGRYALRCDSTSAAVNIGLSLVAASSRYAGGLCRFKKVSGSAATMGVLLLVASTNTDSIRLRMNATGVLGYSFNNGSTYTDTSTNIGTGVHTLEAFVDWDVSTTHTLKIRVDGVEIVNTTGGASSVTASTTTSPVQFGGSTTVASVNDYADMVTYNDPAQYGTLTDWRVIGLEPTADGTHSMTANDFQDDASTNLSNSTTTSWSKVDDAPSAAPSVTDFVQQVVLRTTSYMEWQLRAMTTGYSAPVLVCLAAAMHPVAAATANTVAFRLVSGANASTETAIDTSVASNTLEYRKHHYTTEPGGAAWTGAMVQAPLRARFGYSGDATPPPALDSIMAFVVAQTLVIATATATSATSATATGTATNHQFTGTATGTSATSASATGTASNHVISGTAAGTSATSASATGSATNHQFLGTATGTSATPATATGTATNHQYTGTAAATSGTSASASGTATNHQYSGTATGTSASSATATGVASSHQIVYTDTPSGTIIVTGTATNLLAYNDTMTGHIGGTIVVGGGGQRVIGSGSNVNQQPERRPRHYPQQQPPRLIHIEYHLSHDAPHGQVPIGGTISENTTLGGYQHAAGRGSGEPTQVDVLNAQQRLRATINRIRSKTGAP